MPGPDPLRAIFDLVVPRAVDSIDLNQVIGEIDLDDVLARIDLDVLLARVDVDAIVSRIDVDALMQRVDVDALMERIDIAGIMKKAQVEAIVRATAGGLGNRMLDLIRRQLVGLDIIATRIVERMFHRQVVEPVNENGSFTGQLAGGASRLAAFLADAAIEAGVFSMGVAVISFVVSFFVGQKVQLSHGNRVVHIVALATVVLVYQWLSLVVAGRTFGRALAGLRVTAPDRSPLSVGAVTKRVLVYPFSFILGLGLVGIVTGRRHRALHDMAAPSLVYYDWGDRPAAMPAPITRFLERRGVGVHDVTAVWPNGSEPVPTGEPPQKTGESSQTNGARPL